MAKSELSVILTGKDNLTPTIKNVQKSLNDLGAKSSKMEDIQKGFNKIQNSSAPLSKKIRDIKKEMEALIVSGQHTTAEGKKMWEEMSKAAKKYDEQLKQIQKDTRASGDGGGGFDMKSLTSGMADKVGLGGIGNALANPYVLAGAAIAGAGKALYDYNVELDRSLQKTAQFTGLSGDELLSLRNGIKSVADTFGKDYDTVLASVDGLMAQFGIDAEEALQIIRNGFIGGADDSGRMLDMINQFAPSFNDAGISASELVAIIGNTRSGIFNEEGMDLFQKGATKIREFSSNLQASLEAVGINATEMYDKLQSGQMTTVQAIQAISSKLKELNPQSQEVGEIMKQVFGKTGAKAGYELVTALADVETNLDVVKTQTGEWGAAMEQLEKADREFENALSSLFGIADGGFSTMTTKLKADVYGAVAKVINGFIDWYNKSIIIRAAIQQLALTFKNAWEIIKAILKLFMNGLQSLGEMIEGVLTLDWNKVKNGWKNGMSNILKTIATGFENIKENVADAAEQTLNGQIKRIEVPVDVEYTSNNHGNGGGGKGNGKGLNGSGNNGGKTTVKTEKVKTEIEVSREQLKKVRDSIQTAINDFNDGLITKETLQQTVDAANKYFEDNGIKSKVELEFSDENGFEKVKQKIQQQVKEAKKEIEKSTPTIQTVDDSNFEKGSTVDKRQSLANANSIAEQYVSDYKLGIIGFDEVKNKFDELNRMLEELDPNLKLDLHINDDGTIRTASEEVEHAKQNIDMIGGSVSQVGNVFGALGSAIGGTGGEILNFAGTTISAIGQIIPQIVGLIAAQNAEAIAAGTASGAALPFPANIAAIASIIATIAGIFASLPQFATGGVVGGTSYSGDKVLARLNSGEGVLTRKGMNNLQNVMENNMPLSPMGGKVEFVIDGRVMKGVLNNVNKKISLQS